MKLLIKKILGMLKADSSHYPTINNLDPEAFKKALEKSPENYLIDVRTAREIRSGKLKDAIEINFMSTEFTKQIATLSRAESYFMYCRSGNRSKKACKEMQRMGFENLYNLEGGLLAWPFEKNY